MFDALPLSYGGDIVIVIVIVVVVVVVVVVVHFSWVSVFLGSTPFNVQLDVPGTQVPRTPPTGEPKVPRTPPLRGGGLRGDECPPSRFFKASEG